MIPPSLRLLQARLAALARRAEITKAIRAHFHQRQFLEVETPLLLNTVAPEEHIVPIRADQQVLATSPELQMKQLVAAGAGPIFQLGRSFRAGESGRRHNPEFTLLEWYRPGNTVHHLIRDLEGLIGAIAKHLDLGTEFQWQGRRIDLSAPFLVTSVQDAFLTHAGWDPVADFDADRFDLDLVDKVEPQLGIGRPEVLAWYPSALGSLSRCLPADPRVSQRMELYIEGLELANGFVELNDAEEQRQRFHDSREAIARRGDAPLPMPERFLEALPYLDDTVGIALGVDRLVMLFSDTADISDVQAFGIRET